MAQQFLSLMVGFWAIAVSPTLCVGGWLGHPCAHDAHENHACDAEEEAALPPSENHDHDCTHENNCLADPCLQLVRPDDDCSQVVVVNPCPITFVESNETIQNTAYPVSHEEVRPPPNAHHAKGRPFADRDIPLLI